jgi:phosphate butyryltransferase
MRHVKDVTVRGAFRNYGKLGIFEYQQDGMKRYLSVAVPAPGADVRTKKIFIQKANRILLRKYGIGKPKVAMLDFTEQSRQFRKVPTIRAGIALRRYFSKNAKSCIVEGPMAYDLGDSKEAAKAKGYDSIVAGDADMYLAPDYNTGSMLEALYKYSGKLKLGWDASDLSYGGLATDNGEPVFVVVPSRSDSEFHKERSLDVAAELMSRDREEGVNIRQKKRGATGKTLPGGSIAEALKVVNKSLVEPDILGDVFTRKEFASNRFNGK